MELGVVAGALHIRNKTFQNFKHLYGIDTLLQFLTASQMFFKSLNPNSFCCKLGI